MTGGNHHSSRQDQSSDKKNNITDSLNQNLNKRPFFEITQQENTRASAGHSSPFHLQADFNIPTNHPQYSNQPRYQDQDVNLSQYEGRSSTQSDQIQQVLSFKAKHSPKQNMQLSNQVSNVIQAKPAKFDAKSNYQSQKNLENSQGWFNGLQNVVSSESSWNFASHTQQRAYSLYQPESSAAPNNSLTIPPIQHSLVKPAKTMEQTIKNLHPQGLYLGNKPRPKKQLQPMPVDQSNAQIKKLKLDSQLSKAVNMKKVQSEAPNIRPKMTRAAKNDMLLQDEAPNRANLSDNASQNSENSKILKQNFNNFQGQSGTSSIDTSPLSKQMAYQQKVTYKNRVNLKSNLKGEVDRESQRSLIESTNAYIKTKQEMKQADSLNASVGLGSTNATTVNVTTVENTAAPYSPVALPPNLSNKQNKLPQQIFKLQSTAAQQRLYLESRGSCDYSTNQLVTTSNNSNNYDPDSSLFQLRSQVHQVPFVGNSRKILVPSVNNDTRIRSIEKLPGVKMKAQVHSHKNIQKNIGQQINQQRQIAENSEFEQINSSPNFAQSVHLNSSFAAKKNLNMIYNQVQSNSTQVQNRMEQNPFKKGPKLHLFRKSRRLKTSSATRTQPNEDDNTTIEMDRHASIDDAQYQGNGEMQVQIQSIGYTDMKNLNKTVEKTDNQMNDFQYGTLDKQMKIDNLQTPVIRSRKHYAEFTSESGGKTAHLADSLVLNQQSTEKDYSEPNPYAYQHIKSKAEQTIRPHTTEMSNYHGQSIIDIYSDDYGPNEHSERSGSNPLTIGSGAPQIKTKSNIGIDQNSSRNNYAKVSKGSRVSKQSRQNRGLNLLMNSNGETTLDDAFKHSFYNQKISGTGETKSGRSPFGVSISKQAGAKTLIGSRNIQKDGIRTGKSSKGGQSNSSKTYQINGADLNVLRNFNDNSSQQTQKRRQIAQTAHRNYDNLHQTDSQSELEGKINRHDSSETPCFMHTPQRTDSNWNGSAYLNQTQTNKSRALYTAMMSKTKEHEEQQSQTKSRNCEMTVRDEEAKSNSKNAKKSSSIDDSLSRGPSLAK